MKIIPTPNFADFLKNKWLLLDTNVFRDISCNPTVFTEFFISLKKAGATLATVEAVKFELMKGSATPEKYKEKKNLVDGIVDNVLPYTPKTTISVYDLIQMFGIDGTALDLTDFILGAMLKQYGQKICLMTRDISDFIQTIFDLKHIVNVTHKNTIFTYGIYQFKETKKLESSSDTPF